MTIKPYEEKYADDVRRICIDTGSEDNKVNEEHRRFSLLMYCDEYIKYETVFVLVDEEDHAQGYVMCAEDCKSFEEHMTPYLEKIRKECPAFAHRADISEYLLLQNEYPAHMHIDIEEEYTGGGNGRALAETLFAKLREDHVKGIMLGVDLNNKRAVSFYQKVGLSILYEQDGGALMGMQFE